MLQGGCYLGFISNSVTISVRTSVTRACAPRQILYNKKVKNAATWKLSQLPVSLMRSS